MPAPPSNAKHLDKFIGDFSESGGAEMSNTQPFIERLCDIFTLPKPDLAKEQNHLNDYVFERSVNFKHPDGTQTKGRIDLYKRNCFILEAKQSAKRGLAKYNPDQHELIPEDRATIKSGTAKRGTRNWDSAMVAARKQAENYARALPVEHGYPPFLLVVDIGHVIEIYADFSGQGKNYAHFPDRQSYRIGMDDLRDEKIQPRLRSIWTDPQTLDPTRISAEVTRDIADRLAKIANRLEKRHDPKEVAEFLMRCLFTMFAEDVKLLPEHCFAELLGKIKDTPKNFKPALEDLWRVMDEGGYFTAFNTSLKRFNGSLFKKRHAFALEPDEIHELWIAAKRDWQDVEPAIFGTLLERALDVRERAKLGAHYTPRTYVERLVVPTIIEPLRQEWEEVQAHVQELQAAKKTKEAIAAVKTFHHQLCTTRVLDPACGTGNFLYVSLELMKKLEGEVLEALESLGYKQDSFALEGETVNPKQFYGLELNPRAVAIADLVLWIGYLKWQLKTNGVNAIAEPVLHAYGTIKHQDAILAYDKQEQLKDDNGKPLTRWDGHTVKLHPITGEAVPDASAQIPLYKYANPRPAKWPEAEYIIGNPPFIGGGAMRSELGDGYVEACWDIRSDIPAKADFVMHFWDMAATQLLAKNSKLRRFGFITTNSITQTFSRHVIEQHMAAKTPLSLVYAIADHPWMKASDKAAVRIAMTVAEKGEKQGVLAKVISESELNTDTPKVGLENKEGIIQADFRIGLNTKSIQKLNANDEICRNGMMLAGKGFIVQPVDAARYKKESNLGSNQLLRKYVNGGDLTGRIKDKFVIDIYGSDIDKVRNKAPNIYQHLLKEVKPERDHNRRPSFKERWWLFGEPRKTFRPALEQIGRFIATTETSKHRFFQFVSTDVLPDHMVVAIAIEDAAHLSALSSRLHIHWALSSGGTLEDRPRYNKTQTFDPFPLPVFEELPKSSLKRLQDLGERLDAFRKERLAQHDFLTMTSLYNVMERLRELDKGFDVPALNQKEKDIHETGLVSMLKEIHDDIDRAIFEAYGWADLIPDLVGKPGATTPSPHKTPEQEAAEEELLTRLVSLNQERAAEEKQGKVRWLRPDYQIPKLGRKAADAVEGDQMEANIDLPDTSTLPVWPADGLEQIRIVRDMLTKAPSPIASETIATAFTGRNTVKRKERMDMVLQTLVSTGAAQIADRGRYFIPKQ